MPRCRTSIDNQAVAYVGRTKSHLLKRRTRAAKGTAYYLIRVLLLLLLLLLKLATLLKEDSYCLYV